MSAQIEQARRRVQVSEAIVALIKLDAVNSSASVLLAKLLQVVAEEAARTPRFANAIAEAFVTPDAEGVQVSAPVVVASSSRRRAAAAPKAKREPGAFDPFDVYRESGEGMLLERLSALDAEGIKDIIAEQKLDTHKETGRKRKIEVLAAWTVERVQTVSSKGSAFR